MKFAQLIGKELELDNPFALDEPRPERLVLAQAKGKGGGGGGKTTTVQKADPWSGQQPYLKRGFSEAQKLFNQGPQSFFPDATYVPFSDQSSQAIDMTTQRAMDGSPVTAAAQNNAAATLSGDFLNSNPYLDQIFDQGANDIMSKVNANFSSAGRTGSGAHQGVMADELGDYHAQLYGQNYANERNNQTKMTAFAPQTAGMDYFDLDRLAGVGQMVENKDAQVLQDSMDRFMFEQNADWDNLTRFQNAINGNYGGTTTKTAPGAQRDPLTGAIGSAMMAHELGGGNNLLTTGAAILGSLL